MKPTVLRRMSKIRWCPAPEFAIATRGFCRQQRSYLRAVAYRQGVCLMRMSAKRQELSNIRVKKAATPEINAPYLHAADATGRKSKHVGQSGANHPNIQVLERSNAVDLIISDKMGLPGPRRSRRRWITESQ